MRRGMFTLCVTVAWRALHEEDCLDRVKLGQRHAWLEDRKLRRRVKLRRIKQVRVPVGESEHASEYPCVLLSTPGPCPVGEVPRAEERVPVHRKGHPHCMLRCQARQVLLPAVRTSLCDAWCTRAWMHQ